VTHKHNVHTNAASNEPSSIIHQHNNQPSNENLNHEISVASELAFQLQFDKSNPRTIATTHAAITVLKKQVRD
jgi:hypothetical protein